MLKKDRFKIIPIANCIVEKDGKILLMHRNDGFFKGGFWVLPGGHIDGNETARHAAVRELKEEIGITANEEDAEFCHIVHNLGETLERFDMFFRIKNYSGEIKNIEPQKCSDLKFFSYDDLPPKDQISGTTLLALTGMREKNFYSERGFIEGNRGFSAQDKFSFEAMNNILEKTESKKLFQDLIKQELSKPNPNYGKIAFMSLGLCQENGQDIRTAIYEEAMKYQ